MKKTKELIIEEKKYPLGNLWFLLPVLMITLLFVCGAIDMSNNYTTPEVSESWIDDTAICSYYLLGIILLVGLFFWIFLETFDERTETKYKTVRVIEQ